MGCSHINDYLARQRPGDELAPEVRSHVDGCAECRRTQAEDARVWELLGSYAAPAAPADLFAKIERMAAADELARRRRPAPALWRFAAAAAAVVALGISTGTWLGSSAVAPVVAAPGAETLDDHALYFDVAPPGSLTSAYASLTVVRR